MSTKYGMKEKIITAPLSGDRYTKAMGVQEIVEKIRCIVVKNLDASCITRGTIQKHAGSDGIATSRHCG